MSWNCEKINCPYSEDVDCKYDKGCVLKEKNFSFPNIVDAFNKARADERKKVLDEVIKLFNEMRPSLGTHISDFGDMLEQMKEQKAGEPNDIPRC